MGVCRKQIFFFQSLSNFFFKVFDFRYLCDPEVLVQRLEVLHQDFRVSNGVLGILRRNRIIFWLEISHVKVNI